MRTVLVLVALVGIAMLVWFFASRPIAPSAASIEGRAATERAAGTPAEALAAQENASERQAEVAANPAPASTPVAHERTGLTVRSSMGFELPFLEWEAREKDWSRIDLDHGHCEIGPMTLPCRVRAPGHVAALAQKDGDEIVLEPDALLVLDAKGLRACTALIAPYDIFTAEHEDVTKMRPELRRAIAWGWLSDDRWAICVTSEIAHEAHGGEPIAIVIHWRDERRAEVEFNATAGARGSWAVPCEQLISGAPLDVRIVSPQGESVGPRALHIWRIRGAPEGGRTEEHPWGAIHFQPPNDFWMDRTVPRESSTVHFDFVPTGVRLSLSARDGLSSAYGRLVFVHDGTSRTLELRTAFELVGRVVSDVDGAPIASADLDFQFLDGEKPSWGWRAWARHVDLERDGGFSLRGPDAPLPREEVPLDPPRTLTVSIGAPGFEAFEHRFETGGAQRFDCGEVRLKPLAGQIVLAPGHGLVSKSIEWETLRTSSRPSTLWSIRNGALAADGSMSIALVEAEESTTEKRLYHTLELPAYTRTPSSWPAETSRWLTVHVLLGDRDEEWLFERQGDGRYAAVPRREREIVVECGAQPVADKHWTIGWIWQDQWGFLSQIAPRRVGETIRMHIATPADGASMWWSAAGTPPGILGAPTDVGGSVPLDASDGKVVLR